MRTIGFGILALSLAVLAVACGMKNPAVGPSYAASRPSEPRADAALVYVMRLKAEPVGVPATVLADGREVVALSSWGFTWFYLPPGRHVLEARWPQVSGQLPARLSLEVVAGQAYHVELLGVSRPTGHGQILGSSFELRTPFVATPRLDLCGYQKPAEEWTR
jgi:hypothetical protein